MCAFDAFVHQESRSLAIEGTSGYPAIPPHIQYLIHPRVLWTPQRILFYAKDMTKAELFFKRMSYVGFSYISTSAYSCP
jgi:hypothetical protein